MIREVNDNLRRLQAKEGMRQAASLVLGGNIEADATSIRKCPVSLRNQHFSAEVASWKLKHPQCKVPAWLVLNVRVGGLGERGQTGKCVLAMLPHNLVRLGAVPPTESVKDIVSSKLLTRVANSSTVLSFKKRNTKRTRIPMAVKPGQVSAQSAD